MQQHWLCVNIHLYASPELRCHGISPFKERLKSWWISDTELIVLLLMQYSISRDFFLCLSTTSCCFATALFLWPQPYCKVGSNFTVSMEKPPNNNMYFNTSLGLSLLLGMCSLPAYYNSWASIWAVSLRSSSYVCILPFLDCAMAEATLSTNVCPSAFVIWDPKNLFFYKMEKSEQKLVHQSFRPKVGFLFFPIAMPSSICIESMGITATYRPSDDMDTMGE